VVGKDIQVCADRLTPVEMAEIISKVGGKPVNTLHITLEQFYSPEFKKQVTEPIWANFRAYIEGSVAHLISRTLSSFASAADPPIASSFAMRRRPVRSTRSSARLPSGLSRARSSKKLWPPSRLGQIRRETAVTRSEAGTMCIVDA
jgi:hypothetical protein